MLIMLIKSKNEDLETFITIANTGSFTSAANQLDTQVAKVSRAITRLECDLKVTLFNRSTRRIDLTEEGQLFLEYVTEGLDIISRGEEALNNLQSNPAGKLRVDAASPFLYHQLIPYIEDFQLAYPGITLELLSNESIVDLIEKKTDIAIRIGKLSDSNLYAKKLGLSKLRIVASPRYLNKKGAPTCIDDLKEHQIIGFADSPKLNNWFLKGTISLKPSITASSGEAIRQLCINGNGIAVLSDFMVKKDIEKQVLVEILPNSILSPNPREDVHAVYNKNSVLSSRISAFIDFFSTKISL